jgi:hypothetical protein
MVTPDTLTILTPDFIITNRVIENIHFPNSTIRDTGFPDIVTINIGTKGINLTNIGIPGLSTVEIGTTNSHAKRFLAKFRKIVLQANSLGFPNRALRTRFHPHRLGHFAPLSFPAYGGKIQAIPTSGRGGR